MMVGLDFSIVIPVYNREDLTQQCLATLPPTLAGAGLGEVIVVDNGSEPATAAVLAAHPWVRVIRNERNLGFAAACNQGTRAANGRYVVHLNNDTVGHDGWLANMLRVFAEEANVGIVGARLLFPNGTLQHAGVVSGPTRLGPEGAIPYHALWGWPGDFPAAQVRTDFDAVTGACLVMERDLYLALGGFDETYWNGYEDVDLCYKVRAHGLRVVYEPTAVLVHYESQSGIQRKRRVLHNVRELAERWRATVVPDHNRIAGRVGFLRRDTSNGSAPHLPLPPAFVLVHGDAPADADAWLAHARSGPYPIHEVLWCAAGRVPHGATDFGDPLRALAAATHLRGDRYLALVDTATALEARWFDDLVDTVEFASDICAATVVAADEFDALSMPLTADARCTLLSLRTFPQAVVVDTTFPTIGGAVAAFVADAVVRGRAVRAVRRPTATLGRDLPDATFEARRGSSIARARRADPIRLEELSRRADDPVALSIIIVTRNCANEAKNAITSLREFTRFPYELIVVDNGSEPAARDAVAALPGVMFLSSTTDLGNAAARNVGARHATGTHLCFLDDDVVVPAFAVASLTAAFADDRTLGVTGPMTNNGEAFQMGVQASYATMDDLNAVAKERMHEFAGVRLPTDVVGGFCMCVSREAFDVVGGFDPRFPTGTFEAADFCIRVRAAGYGVDVCEDAYVHHTGGVSLLANGRTSPADRAAAWPLLAEKFGLSPVMPERAVMLKEYAQAVRAGFDPRAHRIAQAPRP
jgi:GT2 family glycosyltransferase